MNVSQDEEETLQQSNTPEENEEDDINVGSHDTIQSSPLVEVDSNSEMNTPSNSSTTVRTETHHEGNGTFQMISLETGGIVSLASLTSPDYNNIMPINRY